jgi:hypothetical protein
MKFSQVDAIGYELKLNDIKKAEEKENVFVKVYTSFLFPKNPLRFISLFVPSYTWVRSVSFCNDVEKRIEAIFNPSHLAKILYMDFLEYVKNTNSIQTAHNRLELRSNLITSTKSRKPFVQRQGIVFEGKEALEEISTHIKHIDLLRGECLLKDMKEFYPDHVFEIENLLAVLYFDFVEDMRKGIIEDPIKKIAQYV